MLIKYVFLLLFVGLVCNELQKQENVDDDEISKDLDIDDVHLKIAHDQKKDPLFWGRRRRRRRRRRSQSQGPSCPSVAYSECADIVTNGCGSGTTTTLPMPFRSEFTEACNKHDVCYSCGFVRNWSRAQCDDRFHSDMIEACKCKFSSSLQRIPCLAAAAAYYKGVQTVGNKFYLQVERDYCNDNCVIERGSPHVVYG